MKKIISVLALITSIGAFAGVSVYSGTSGEKLFIEESDRDIFYIKFTGIKSPWENKIIKTIKNSKTANKYQFDYKLELSTGILNKTYSLVTEAEDTLIAGTMTKQVILWTPQTGRNGRKLSWNKELTTNSQNIHLSDDFKKTPFSPQVD